MKLQDSVRFYCRHFDFSNRFSLNIIYRKILTGKYVMCDSWKYKIQMKSLLIKIVKQKKCNWSYSLCVNWSSIDLLVLRRIKYLRKCLSSWLIFRYCVFWVSLLLSLKKACNIFCCILYWCIYMLNIIEIPFTLL